jgi:hypothetical protein
MHTSRMYDMNMPLPQTELEDFFNRFDSDHDNKISFKEFKMIVRRKGYLIKLIVHLRAFVSFIAIVLFWNGLYDATTVLPAEALVQRYVDDQGLDSQTGMYVFMLHWRIIGAWM